MTVEVAIASLSDVAWTSTAVGSTSAASSAVVPPFTLALGRLTAMEMRPPVPMSDWAVALLFEVAVTSTRPVDVHVPVPEVAFVLPSISAPAPPPAPANEPMPTTKVSAVAVFAPCARTVIDEEPVTLPPRFATRLPLTVACVSMIEREPIRPSEPAVACASAVACSGPTSSASTRTAPELPSVAPEPTFALDVAGHRRLGECAGQADDTDADHCDRRARVVGRVRTNRDRGRAGEGAVDLGRRVAAHLGDRDEDVDGDAAGGASGGRRLAFVRRGGGDEDGAGRRDVPRRGDRGERRAALGHVRDRDAGGQDPRADVDGVRLRGVAARRADGDAAGSDGAVCAGARARRAGERRERDRPGEAGADAALDRDRLRRRVDRVVHRDGQARDRAGVAEQDVADRRARVAADVADGDGRADRAGADADADRLDVDRPDRGRRHEDAAAGLVDRRAVVDVRVLACRCR